MQQPVHCVSSRERYDGTTLAPPKQQDETHTISENTNLFLLFRAKVKGIIVKKQVAVSTHHFPALALCGSQGRLCGSAMSYADSAACAFGGMNSAGPCRAHESSRRSLAGAASLATVPNQARLHKIFRRAVSHTHVSSRGVRTRTCRQRRRIPQGLGVGWCFGAGCLAQRSQKLSLPRHERTARRIEADVVGLAMRSNVNNISVLCRASLAALHALESSGGTLPGTHAPLVESCLLCPRRRSPLMGLYGTH